MNPSLQKCRQHYESLKPDVKSRKKRPFISRVVKRILPHLFVLAAAMSFVEKRPIGFVCFFACLVLHCLLEEM